MGRRKRAKTEIREGENDGYFLDNKRKKNSKRERGNRNKDVDWGGLGWGGGGVYKTGGGNGCLQ